MIVQFKFERQIGYKIIFDTVTVEVERQLGFNIIYDTMTDEFS